MIIYNTSDQLIICSFNHTAVTLAPADSFACEEDFDRIRFNVADESYSVPEARDAKILKILGALDDPFKLIREYHLTVVSSYTKEQLADCRHIFLTVHFCYADTETRTHYHFVKAEAEGGFIAADDMDIYCKDKIVKDFADNHRKLTSWQVLWDMVMEPTIFLGIIVCFVLYKFLSVWFETGALFMTLSVFVLSQIIIFLLKKKKLSKRYDLFLDLCCHTAIKNRIL